MKSLLFLVLLGVTSTAAVRREDESIKAFSQALACEKKNDIYGAWFFYKRCQKMISSRQFKSSAEKEPFEKLLTISRQKSSDLKDLCYDDARGMVKSHLVRSYIELRSREQASATSLSKAQEDLESLLINYEKLEERVDYEAPEAEDMQVLQLENLSLKKYCRALEFVVDGKDGVDFQSLKKEVQQKQSATPANTQQADRILSLKQENKKLRNKIAQLEKGASVSDDSVRQMEQQAQALFDGDMQEQAVEIYSRILRINAVSKLAFMNMLDFYSKKQQWAEILSLVERHGHHYNEIDADLMAGYAAVQMQKNWLALRYYSNALAKNAEDSSALSGMAIVVGAMRRDDWALELLGKAFNSSPKDANVAYNMAVLKWRRGEKESAFTWYEKSLLLGASRDTELEKLLNWNNTLNKEKGSQ